MTEHDLQPLLDVQQNQLGLTFNDASGIDTKALAVLAINAAILLFVGQASLQVHKFWQELLFLMPFIISLVCDGFAIWPRKYFGASLDLDGHPEYLAMDHETLVLQLLSDTELAINKNEYLNTFRWRFCATSIVLTVLGSIGLFVIL